MCLAASPVSSPSKMICIPACQPVVHALQLTPPEQTVLGNHCCTCAGEAGALLPVIATMLQFSPQEMDKCKHALAQFEGQAAAAASAQADAGYLGGWGSWAFGSSDS